MPRPFPQREPTPDEQTPAQRVLAVFDALQRAKADAARLPEAEGALSELIAAETLGEAVDHDALDQAKADAARCQQARGLTNGLQRRLVAALEVYRESERERLGERKDAGAAEVKHLESALAALQKQAGEVAEKLQAELLRQNARVNEWTGLGPAHTAYWRILSKLMGRERPELNLSMDELKDAAGNGTPNTVAASAPTAPPTPAGPFQVIGAGEAYDVAG